jgi:hypothetical protein
VAENRSSDQPHDDACQGKASALQEPDGHLISYVLWIAHP